MDITNLQTKGFVAIPYPKELRDAVLGVEGSWKKFCDLPSEVKGLFKYSNSSTGVGYESKDGSGPLGDIKENFDVSIGGLSWLSNCLNSSQSEIAGDFVTHAIKLIELMTPFVVSFAIECEKAFCLDGFSHEIAEGQNEFFVRFIHYPPQKQSGEPIAQAHPDQSGFTLHLFESLPGLEGFTYDGDWIPLTVSGSETVIIPDMQMQLRSRGGLRALWHRVVATEESTAQGRYSAVSFIQFRNTPKYNKEENGRLQEKPEGFNYTLSHEAFSKLFK